MVEAYPSARMDCTGAAETLKETLLTLTTRSQHKHDFFKYELRIFGFVSPQPCKRDISMMSQSSRRRRFGCPWRAKAGRYCMVRYIADPLQQIFRHSHGSKSNSFQISPSNRRYGSRLLQ